MEQLKAELLQQDPRIAEAKKLIRAALADQHNTMTAPRPAIAERTTDYETLLTEMAAMRGGALFYPYLGSGMGNGSLVELQDGSIKYDFITGIGAYIWGHQNPEMVEASIDGALEDTVISGNLQQNRSTHTFLQALLKGANRCGSQLDCAFLSTSGAMANENALKLALHHRFPARRVLAFENCFAGRTLALSHITDKAAYRQGLPEAIAVDYVPFYDPAAPEQSTARALAVLKSHIQRHPKQHALMMFELIQGEGSGYTPGHRDFFIALINCLKENETLICFDEIQSFGRTNELFAFQHFGLDEYADIVSVGKATQVCATLYRESLKPGPGLISQTFTSSAQAIHTGTFILNSLMNEGFLGNDGKIAHFSNLFREKLIALSEKYPQLISGPFGYQGMIAMTLFGGDVAKTKAFAMECFKEGLIGFMAGANPVVMRFLLPTGTVTEADIDGACAIIEKVLERS